MASEEALQANQQLQTPPTLSAVLDPEKQDTSPANVENEEANSFQRPMGKWMWFFVCIGWSLGALLYGIMTLLLF
jgi:hypothetical protein